MLMAEAFRGLSGVPRRAKINWDKDTASAALRAAVADVTRRHGKRDGLVEVASMESNEAAPVSGEAQRKVSP
jgi:hypothetical protein